MHRTIYVNKDGDKLNGRTNFNGGEGCWYDTEIRKWKLNSGMVIDHPMVIQIEKKGFDALRRFEPPTAEVSDGD